ncbi:MAG: hypothetical protein GY847_30570 [Proteobacteria bacterium]|nr:hypothetical protein [Pseudomonadota bacterium]
MTDSHDIRVIAHSGYRADERPHGVVLDGERLDVTYIEDSWMESGVDPSADVLRGFVVRCTGGARFRLIHSDKHGWTGKLLPGPRLI